MTLPINFNELLIKTIVCILCTVIIPRSKFYKITQYIIELGANGDQDWELMMVRG